MLECTAAVVYEPVKILDKVSDPVFNFFTMWFQSSGIVPAE